MCESQNSRNGLKQRTVCCYNRESKRDSSTVHSVVQAVRRSEKNRHFLLLVNLIICYIFIHDFHGVVRAESDLRDG